MTGITARNLVRSLPIPNFDLDTNLSKIYVFERMQVRTPKQLKRFTERWKMLWQLPWMRKWYPIRLEHQIVTGRYNAKRAFKCVLLNSGDASGCGHMHKNKDCISAHLLAPYFLMKLLEISQTMGVSEALALVQLQRALHPDIANDDPELFFHRSRA